MALLKSSMCTPSAAPILQGSTAERLCALLCQKKEVNDHPARQPAHQRTSQPARCTRSCYASVTEGLSSLELVVYAHPSHPHYHQQTRLGLDLIHRAVDPTALQGLPPQRVWEGSSPYYRPPVQQQLSPVWRRQPRCHRVLVVPLARQAET